MTSIESIKKLKLIHLALALFMSALAVAAYFIVDKEGGLAASPEGILNYEVMAILIVFLLLVTSMLVNRAKLRSIVGQGSLEERMEAYLKASILHFALLEGMTLLLTVVFLLSGINNIFLYALLSIAYFLYHRPHPMKLVTDLKLEGDEEDEIREAFKA